jgi:hypothetical protein
MNYIHNHSNQNPNNQNHKHNKETKSQSHKSPPSSTIKINKQNPKDKKQQIKKKATEGIKTKVEP